MMDSKRVIFILLLVYSGNCLSQNPIIKDQYTADPTARVFENKVYLYPSHDILAKDGHGKPGWFCMEDYHAFSSEDLITWKDHGIIVTQNKVPWVKPDSYSMWAPDCVFKNGKYYFYFPAPAKDTSYGRGFSIGVAISEKPYGPFTPGAKPIIGVHGIDPCVLIDRDGQAYIYWAARNIYVARLKENMTELATEPQIIANLPDKGLKEGPFVFERNGTYYLTYPHVQSKTECLEYAIGPSPLGPFKVAGVIMDERSNCWTNHQSIINYNNQWYLFYHSNDLSPAFDKNRSTRVDSLFFNTDGTIKKVTPTLRGVGVTNASEKIQIDRYSLISEKGTLVSFIDTTNRFEGWKVRLEGKGAWIQYNAVNFKERYNSLIVNASSVNGGTILIHLNKPDGPIISEIQITKNSSFKEFHKNTSIPIQGLHNVIVTLKDNLPVEIDWICFE